MKSLTLYLGRIGTDLRPAIASRKPRKAYLRISFAMLRNISMPPSGFRRVLDASLLTEGVALGSGVGAGAGVGSGAL